MSQNDRFLIEDETPRSSIGSTIERYPLKRPLFGFVKRIINNQSI